MAETHAMMQLSKGAANAVMLLAMTFCIWSRFVLHVKGQSPPLDGPGLQPGVHEPAAGHAPPHTALHEHPAHKPNNSRQRCTRKVGSERNMQ